MVVDGAALATGDAAMLTDVREITLIRGDAAEVLVFDLP